MQANHMGEFWFRICPATDPDVEVTQACLDQHTMQILDVDGKSVRSTMWTIPKDNVKQGGQIYKFSVQLPKGLKCERCVIQWDWLCANRPDQKIQETFRGCADVKIQ